LATACPGDHDLVVVDALFDQLQGIEPPRRDAAALFKAFTSARRHTILAGRPGKKPG